MATPMEYDVLNECYWDAMATFARLTTSYHVPESNYKADQENYNQIWLSKVHGVELSKIDYEGVISELNAIVKPWEDLDEKLFEEQE